MSRYDQPTEQMRLIASRWCEAHGMDLADLNPHNIERRTDDGFQLGITWTVVVGNGHIDLDQSMPGVLDRWTWSAPRQEWWRKVLGRLPRTGVIRARRDAQGDHGGDGRVLQFPVGGQDGMAANWNGDAPSAPWADPVDPAPHVAAALDIDPEES